MQNIIMCTFHASNEVISHAIANEVVLARRHVVHMAVNELVRSRTIRG